MGFRNPVTTETNTAPGQPVGVRVYQTDPGGTNGTTVGVVEFRDEQDTTGPFDQILNRSRLMMVGRILTLRNRRLRALSGSAIELGEDQPTAGGPYESYVRILGDRIELPRVAAPLVAQLAANSGWSRNDAGIFHDAGSIGLCGRLINDGGFQPVGSGTEVMAIIPEAWRPPLGKIYGWPVSVSTGQVVAVELRPDNGWLYTKAYSGVIPAGSLWSMDACSWPART